MSLDIQFSQRMQMYTGVFQADKVGKLFQEIAHGYSRKLKKMWDGEYGMKGDWAEEEAKARAWRDPLSL